MKRRLFLKSSVSSMLAAPAWSQAAANAAPGDTQAAGRIFYDKRFDDARILASRLASPRALTPVNGDITATWLRDAGLASSDRALALRGVTTESFHFCLKTLLQTHAHVETQIERVSNDLYSWSIKTTPKTTIG